MAGYEQEVWGAKKKSLSEDMLQQRTGTQQNFP